MCVAQVDEASVLTEAQEQLVVLGAVSEPGSWERRSRDYWCCMEMQSWPSSSALLQIAAHAGHWHPKVLLEEQCILTLCCLLRCMCSPVEEVVLWGRRTTSVNEESEQAAGQDKYLSAGHLPHLSSSPVAWLVPALEQCLPVATGPAGTPYTTSGASRPGQTLLPTISLSQRSPSTGSCGEGRADGSRGAAWADSSGHQDTE